MQRAFSEIFLSITNPYPPFFIGIGVSELSGGIPSLLLTLAAYACKDYFLTVPCRCQIPSRLSLACQKLPETKEISCARPGGIALAPILGPSGPTALTSIMAVRLSVCLSVCPEPYEVKLLNGSADFYKICTHYR